jgi:hypothetical protein
VSQTFNQIAAEPCNLSATLGRNCAKISGPLVFGFISLRYRTKRDRVMIHYQQLHIWPEQRGEDTL